MKKVFCIGLCMCLCLGIGFAKDKNTDTQKEAQLAAKREASIKKLWAEYYLNSVPDRNKVKVVYTPLFNQAVALWTNPQNFVNKKQKHVAFKAPDYEQVRKLLLKSYLTEKNEMALTSVAHYYVHLGKKRDLKTSAEFLKIATELAKRGNCLGLLESAKFFKYGIGDVPKNEKEAHKILKSAFAKCQKSIMIHPIHVELYSLEQNLQKTKEKK